MVSLLGKISITNGGRKDGTSFVTHLVIIFFWYTKGVVT